MEIAASNIVRSVAGRDQGKLFIVLAVEGEYLLLADGKSRKVESPKRKKRRHVLFVAADENRLSEKIRGGSPTAGFAKPLRLTARRFIRTRRDNVWQNPT